MINIIFIIIALIIIYLITYLSRYLLFIAEGLGLKKLFKKSPLLRSVSYMLILGIVSTAFQFAISFPFTSKTGFNIENIDFSLYISAIYCVFIFVLINIFMFIYKKITGRVSFLPYSVLEDFEYEPYYDLSESKCTRIMWVIYRWIVPPYVKEVLFRGIVLTVLDVVIKGYFDLYFFQLGYSVIFAQIIYHLAHIRIVRFRPLKIKVSLMEQLRLIPLGLVAGVLYYYTGSLMGPLIIHSFHSGVSAILYIIFRKKQVKKTSIRKEIN
ncbi:MAG: type II CAAX prenyl endopeptidase Rce1 family protein [Spirochaetota bacterium]